MILESKDKRQSHLRLEEPCAENTRDAMANGTHYISSTNLLHKGHTWIIDSVTGKRRWIKPR